jgi:hypothetical protein
VDVLFFGDAPVQCWCAETGGDVWKRNYAGLKAFNLGMASSLIQNPLWRVNDGALEGATPKVVIIHAGIHNVWTTRCKGRELAEGVANLVNAVHQRLPQAKVLLVGIIPSVPPDKPYRTTARCHRREVPDRPRDLQGLAGRIVRGRQADR